jgi:hypothetical protein
MLRIAAQCCPSKHAATMGSQNHKIRFGGGDLPSQNGAQIALLDGSVQPFENCVGDLGFGEESCQCRLFP